MARRSAALAADLGVGRTKRRRENEPREPPDSVGLAGSMRPYLGPIFIGLVMGALVWGRCNRGRIGASHRDTQLSRDVRRYGRGWKRA
jgi:hypothetical protein